MPFLSGILTWKPDLWMAWSLVLMGAMANTAGYNFIKQASLAVTMEPRGLYLLVAGLTYLPALGCSFFFLRTLPFHVGSPAVVGLLVVGTFVSGPLFYGEKVSLTAVLWLGVIVLGIIGLAQTMAR